MRNALAGTLAVLLIAGVHAQDPMPASKPVSPPVLETRQLEIPFEASKAGAAPIVGYALWITRDGGLTWARDPKLHPGPNVARYSAPDDGRYGFLVRPRDRAGRELPPPAPGTKPETECIVDTRKPELEVFAPQRDDQLYAATPLTIKWRATDANLDERPVELHWREKPGDPWRPMRTDSNPMRRAEDLEGWWSELATGTFEIRVKATDRAGHVREVIVPDIRVVPFEGFRGNRTIAADPYSAFRKFPIHYRVFEYTPVQVKNVEIWWRYEYGTWSRAIDPDTRSPFTFEAENDGTYFFYLRAVTYNGESDRNAPGSDTTPDARVIVDTHPPAGNLFVGENPERLPHEVGQPLTIQWRVEEQNLGIDGCQLEISIDGGDRWKQVESVCAPDSHGSELAGERLLYGVYQPQ
ncbi:MAG: hypothetical protein F6K19_36795 [Cyanothece sp. SIO1E1]|nr:hypothetical protein [Cyanothece sp. SIO1E1]